MISVEIYSDVICPWCYIGKRRFEAGVAVAKEAEADLELDVTYRAFLLDPGAPTDGSMPVPDAYAAKFGPRAPEILTNLTAQGAAEGLEFRFDIARRSNTVNAHRLMVLARQNQLADQLNERLMAAYFTEGINIGDVDELVTLGVDVGLEHDTAAEWLAGDGGRVEVAAELEGAADRGVTAVPTFVFNGQFAVPGAQNAEYFARVLAQMASRA